MLCVSLCVLVIALTLPGCYWILLLMEKKMALKTTSSVQPEQASPATSSSDAMWLFPASQDFQKTGRTTDRKWL